MVRVNIQTTKIDNYTLILKVFKINSLYHLISFGLNIYISVEIN